MSHYEQLHSDGEYSKLLELAEEIVSTAEGKFWQITALGSLGRYEDALELSLRYEIDLSNMESEWQGKLINRIGSIYHRKGELDMALQYYNRSLNLAADERQKAVSFNNIGLVHWNKSEYNKAIDYYRRSLVLLRQHGTDSQVASSLSNIGLLYVATGDLDKALEHHLQSLNLKLDIGNATEIALSYFHLGSVSLHKGEIDKAFSYQMKSLEIYERLDNQYEIGWVLNFLGLINWNKGELDTALNYYKRSLQVHERVGNKQDIADVLNNIGLIRRNLGDNVGALKHYKQSLVMREKLGNKQDIASSLNNISEIFAAKGDYSNAISYANQGLQLRQSIGNPKAIAASLRSLVYYFVENQKTEKSQPYYSQLEEIANLNNNKIIQLYFKQAKALVLKTSEDEQDKITSKNLLRMIVETTDFDFEIKFSSLNHLVELLIHDYATYQEEQVLEEIVAYINEMYDLAQQQHLYPVLIDVLILQSRMAIIQNDFERADNILTQAALLADEKDILGYVERVEVEKVVLTRNLQELKGIIQTSSIAYQLEKTAIIEYIKKVRAIIS